MKNFKWNDYIIQLGLSHMTNNIGNRWEGYFAECGNFLRTNWNQLRKMELPRRLWEFNSHLFSQLVSGLGLRIFPHSHNIIPIKSTWSMGSIVYSNEHEHSEESRLYKLTCLKRKLNICVKMQTLTPCKW